SQQNELRSLRGHRQGEHASRRHTQGPQQPLSQQECGPTHPVPGERSHSRNDACEVGVQNAHAKGRASMSRADGADRPEDVDATFAEIVSELRAQGVGQTDPDDLASDETTEPAADPSPPGENALSRDGGWRGSNSEWEDVLFDDPPAGSGENEHFVPPEPPPLPRPGRGAFVVMLFFVIGLVLLITPALLGVPKTVSMPLGLLSLVVGMGLLLLRVRRRLPDNPGPDDGAQV